MMPEYGFMHNTFANTSLSEHLGFALVSHRNVQGMHLVKIRCKAYN